MIKNRFCSFEKRFLKRKTYIIMLSLLMLITLIYKVLPARSRTSEIKVGVVMNDSSTEAKELITELLSSESIYDFYEADSEAELLNEIKRGNTECGYVIPEGFMNEYISGSTNAPLTLYTTPKTTLGETITETLFSYIYQVCAPGILTNTVKQPSYNKEILQALDVYMNGDTIFKLSSQTTGEYLYEKSAYTLTLPIENIVWLMILFSALLGLLTWQRDNERGIYIALPDKGQREIKCITLLAAIFPMLLGGMLAVLINGNITPARILAVPIISIISFLFCLLLSLVIKKSTQLSKVLPFIMFVMIIVVFIRDYAEFII